METGWPPPELLVTVSMTSGMRSRPTRAMRASSAAHVHVAFEGMLQRGLAAFFDDQVNGLGAHEFDVGARGIEVGVVGNDVAFLAGHAEEDALGGASLMGGDDVTVAEDILNGILEAVEAAAAGVAFVAFHDGGPLVRGHGAGAGVGEQVDQDIVGGEKEEVVVGGFEQLLALLARGPAKGFDAFDAEGFDDGFDGHRRFLRGKVQTD